MEIIFSEKYWGFIVIISLLAAAGITFLLYYKNRDANELKVWQRRFLAVLRFIAVFFISFLLAGPLMKTLHRIIQNPVVVLAVDNSASIAGTRANADTKDTYLQMVNKLKNELSSKYDLVAYSFGEQVQRDRTVDFSEKSSNYSEMLQSVYNNHFNDNIGAMILVGDGIYNQGENPVNPARSLSFPIYTMALGDTTIMQDARITDVRSNKTAFLDNMFPVEIDIRMQGLRNRNLKFRILHKGTPVYSEEIRVTDDDIFRTVMTTLEAKEKGLQYYTAVIETSQGEQNKENNSFRFVINVLENKQKILILSNGSHPDAGALKNALENRINYEVSLFTEEPFPMNYKDYNLIVLCQIPSSAQSGKQIVEEAVKNRIPLLFIVGTKSHIQQLNMLGLGMEIALQSNSFEDAQATVNKSFALFTLNNKLTEIIERFPPLEVPFARYTFDANWQTIATQRIKNIDTDRPLMAVANRNGSKMGIILGEGIWRWRLYNYVMTDSHNEFNELIDKTVQYLALRDNEDNFIIDFKPIYQETEPIIMVAEVYNDAYEPVTAPEVSMVLTDSLKNEFNYVFDRRSQFYRLDAGLFPQGDYNFAAKVKIGDKEYTEKGNFAVMPVNIEQLETQANHRLLYQLATISGGGFFLPGDAEKLVETVKENTQIKPFSYFQTLLNEIINLKWLFFILLGILSVEWFLRKFWGIY